MNSISSGPFGVQLRLLAVYYHRTTYPCALRTHSLNYNSPPYLLHTLHT